MTPGTRRLLAVLGLALALRTWGITFGLPAALARPDETQIAGPAVGYLTGNLRPPFFQWPPLFQYIVAVAYAVVAVVGRPVTGFTSIAAFAESRRQNLAPFLYISRSLSMVFGVATVWLVHRLGRRLADETVGLVAALYLAVAFLHVRDSHFGVSDVPMTAFVVGAVLAVAWWHERGGTWRALAAGLLTGLAGATKYNGLGAGAAFVVAWLFSAADGVGGGGRRRAVLAADLAAYGFGVACAFLGASPYTLIEWSRFLDDVREVQGTLAGGPAGIVVGRGWSYFATVVLPAGVGWPMFAAGVAGIAGSMLEQRRRAAVVFAFPLAYYVVAGRGYGVFARHMLPVIPFLCIGAAWATVRLVRMVEARAASPWRPWVMPACVLLVAAVPAAKSVQLDRLLATTDNRVVTARALLDIVPPGSTFYQSGEAYGHIPLGVDGRSADLRTVAFDVSDGAFVPGAPEWVLVQRSPLRYYSAVPDALEGILRRDYVLQRTFLTGAERGPERTWDQQDAFYLPLSGLAGLTRPGPGFELYRRRKDS